jgi:dTDP-4-dehydrorhamnose reductase
VKVLLTGRDGQIGSRVARLLNGFCDCWTLDRADCDLADLDAVRGALGQFKPELVVNAAAFTDVDGAEGDRDRAFAVNAAAPEAMAHWCAVNGAALLHYSTDYVYPGTGNTPWREEDATGPLNAYGESKLAGDEAIAASGAAHLILRTSWVYAAVGRNFLLTMLRLGAERESLRIVDDQIGAPTPAQLVAAVTADILSQSKGEVCGQFGEKGGVVHCAAAGETSWCGFAEAIFEEACARGALLKVKSVEGIATADYPTPAKRPANSRLALDRLRERFGIETPSWRDALKPVMDAVYPKT